MKKFMFFGLITAMFLLGGCGNKEGAFLESAEQLASDSYELALRSESVGDEFADVWHKAIFDKSVKIRNTSYDNFNEALAAQKELFTDNGALEDINEFSERLQAQYSKLSSQGTNKYETEWEAASELYLKAVELRDIAISPTGSYDSFSSSYSAKKSEFRSLVSTVEARLDTTLESSLEGYTTRLLREFFAPSYVKVLYNYDKNTIDLDFAKFYDQFSQGDPEREAYRKLVETTEDVLNTVSESAESRFSETLIITGDLHGEEVLRVEDGKVVKNDL